MPTGTPSSSESAQNREHPADRTVIAITGELGLSSARSVRERLHVALRDTGAQVIIEAPRPRPAGLPDATGSLLAFPVRSSVTEARTTGPGTRSAAA